MANPMFLFDNTILEDGTPSHSSGGTDADFPVTNLTDWRTATAYRWKSSTTGQTTLLYTLAGNTGDADCLAVGGHNLNSANAKIRVRYDTLAAGGYSNAFSEYTPTSDDDFVIPFTKVTDQGLWQIEFNLIGGSFDEVLQVGVITLGLKLETEFGAMAELDPYGFEAVSDGVQSENGSPIGTNVRFLRKSFSMTYGSSSPGMQRDGFFDDTTANTVNFDDDFRPHLELDKPFWFAWNTDISTDHQQVYLCRSSSGVKMPFYHNTTRRAFLFSFEGWAT